MKENNIYTINNLKQIKKDKLYKKYDLKLKINNSITFGKDNLEIDEIFLKNFIEKFSIWYELKYSDNDIHNLFLNNYNINNLDDNIFFKKLNKKEIELLETPSYEHYNIVNSNLRYIHLDKNGIITNIGNYKKEYRKYIGYHIKDLFNFLKNNNLDYKSLDDIIKKYENKFKFKELLFDSIMYRIIERGGSTYGVIRAYIFAKEYQRDIEIPMTYYQNEESLMHSKNFINDYLKNNGHDNIVCCNGYFFKNIVEVSLKEYINWLNIITINVDNNNNNKIIEFKKK